MAGYVAISRIDRATTRVRAGRGLAGAPDDPVGPVGPVGPVTDPAVLDRPVEARPVVQDLTGTGFASDLVDLLADIRQVWRQGLEVLADPQGWRS